jgi:uncharacterized protein YjdB
VQNAISSGPITLNGYSDLATDTVLNVNLLTTLEYQRIQNLVTKSNLTFAAARTQAEGEVLAALNIPTGSYGAFGTLDLSGNTDGDHILEAISSLFVYGNSSGPLSQLIANFQTDIGTNGVITNAATNAALVAAAKAINPAAIAANLTAYYTSEGITFAASNISDWIAQSGDRVIGKFAFQVVDASPSSVFSYPSFVVSQFAGVPVTVTAGILSVNGTPASGEVTFNSGDVVTLSPGPGVFPNEMLTSYLVSGTTNLAKVSFLSSLVSITVTPTTPGVPKGLTQQFTARGTFSDTSTANLTSSVSWTSGTPSIATVNTNSGLANALVLGSTSVTATSGSVSGSATLTVTPAVVESISITPNPAITGTGIGANTQLVATGTYSDGTKQDVSSAANWTSDTPIVATVGPTTGLATGVSLGSTMITANMGSVTATARLWVVTNAFTLAASTSTSILAVSDNNFVYSPSDGSIHLYSGSSDTILSTANIQQTLQQWRVTDEGYVFASFTNAYMWPPASSVPTALATGQEFLSQAPSVHYPWLLWINSGYSTQYTLYNVSTSQQFTIPAAGIGGGNDDCDFTTLNGQLTLFYWAAIQNAQLQQTTNIYRWDQMTNASTQISNDGVSVFPQTDGVSVAWQSGHGGYPGLMLSLLNIATNTKTVLASNMIGFQLSNGLVGWLAATSWVTIGGNQFVGSQAIYAFDGTTTTTISTALSSQLFGSSGGYIVFLESGGLYVWSPAGGRQLIFGPSPSQVFLSGKTVYFSTANQQALYAVTLP